MDAVAWHRPGPRPGWTSHAVHAQRIAVEPYSLAIGTAETTWSKRRCVFIPLSCRPG